MTEFGKTVNDGENGGHTFGKGQDDDEVDGDMGLRAFGYG